MALSSSFPFTGTAIAVFLFLMSLLILTHSQIIPTVPSAPTIAECGPSIIPLTPCAPFVQGQSPEPTLQCCQNLDDGYHQNPGCLCLLLNGTALASLPINTTLALQLPKICSLGIDSSSCLSSAGVTGGSASPGSPSSHVSFRRNPTTATAGAPTITVAPRPSTAKFGMGKSSAYKIAGGQLGALLSLLLANLF